MDILVFGNDDHLAETINLLSKTYKTEYISNTGNHAAIDSWKGHPRLIMIDFKANEEHILDLVSALRKRYSPEQTGIVILSNRQEIFAESLLLNTGADDFWVVPMQRQLLQARINARMRKYKDYAPSKKRENQCEKIHIDRDRYTVSIRNEEFVLSKKEFELLQLFTSAPRKVFSRAMIREQVWSGKDISNSRTIDVHIKNLRDKIGTDIITTVKGVGYKLDCC